MGDKSGISWTDATWNPLAGCTPVSEGCRNCYAAREAIRLAGNPNEKVARAYAGTAAMKGAGGNRRAVFTRRVNLLYDRLDQPLRWKRPRKIFVNSMSDLFHEAVPDEFIEEVFGVMAASPQHVFQVLTKRPERMPDVLHGLASRHTARDGSGWPLPNVWLGTSVENQAAADERIPHLLRTPAAVRWVSCEPLLGDLDLRRQLGGTDVVRKHASRGQVVFRPRSGIDWVVVGGESGPKARPMHPKWARSLRDQCQAAGVAFHFKQWGEHDHRTIRMGKKAAGRLLDGRTWDEEPTHE